MSILPLLALASLVGAAPPPDDAALRMRVYDRTCALVSDHYWDRAAAGAAWRTRCDAMREATVAAAGRAGFYGRLNALLDTLGDSHLFAVDPVRVGIDRAHDKGQAAEGFGFAMAPDADGRWRVTQVRDGAAAARAGVAPGWEVRSVGGRPVDIDYQPHDGEQAHFAFVDAGGREHDLTLTATRDRPLPARRATPLADDMLLVALDGFDPGDERWLRRTIADARPTGVVLDLRGNDGGDADVIARVAGLFFAENRPLVRRIARRESVQRTQGAGPDSYAGPLALLVGPESASGAEALAALIQESGRGAVVGGRTAGALTGAALYDLPDGGQLSVAEFDLRTADGARLEGVGLTPRVLVVPTPADRRAGHDPVLARALALLRRAD